MSLKESAARSLSEALTFELKDALLPDEIRVCVPHGKRCIAEENRTLNHDRCIAKFIEEKSQMACIVAAFYDNVDLLKTAINRGCFFRDSAKQAAAFNNSMACIKFMCSLGHCPQKTNVLKEYAIRGNSLQALRYVVEFDARNHLTDKDINNAIKHGDVDIINFVIGRISSKYVENYMVMRLAKSGLTDCCMSLAEKVDEWVYSDFLEAVELSNFRLARFLFEKVGRKRAFRLKYVSNGTIEVVRFLHGLGCISGIDAIHESILQNDIDYFNELTAEPDRVSFDGYNRGAVTSDAAYVGNLEILKIAVSKSFVLGPEAIENAIWRNNVDCLKYLIEISAPWTYKATYSAVHYGRLECLQILFENDMISLRHDFHFNPLVETGTPESIECLQYLVRKGLVENKDIALEAFF